MPAKSGGEFRPVGSGRRSGQGRDIGLGMPRPVRFVTAAHGGAANPTCEAPTSVKQYLEARLLNISPGHLCTERSGRRSGARSAGKGDLTCLGRHTTGSTPHRGPDSESRRRPNRGDHRADRRARARPGSGLPVGHLTAGPEPAAQVDICLCGAVIYLGVGGVLSIRGPERERTD